VIKRFISFACILFWLWLEKQNLSINAISHWIPFHRPERRASRRKTCPNLLEQAQSSVRSQHRYWRSGRLQFYLGDVLDLWPKLINSETATDFLRMVEEIRTQSQPHRHPDLRNLIIDLFALLCVRRSASTQSFRPLGRLHCAIQSNRMVVCLKTLQVAGYGLPGHEFCVLSSLHPRRLSVGTASLPSIPHRLLHRQALAQPTGFSLGCLGRILDRCLSVKNGLKLSIASANPFSLDRFPNARIVELSVSIGAPAATAPKCLRLPFLR